MGLKSKIFLITIEFLVFAYILVDLYASIFLDINNVVNPENHSVVGLNATNEDSEIVGIGNFAVNEYNILTNSGLKFQGVVKAMFGHSSYMLLIEVMDGTISVSKLYGAIVHVREDQMSLIAFDEYTDSAM